MHKYTGTPRETQTRMVVTANLKANIRASEPMYLIAFPKNMTSLRVAQDNPVHPTVLDHRRAERNREEQ